MDSGLRRESPPGRAKGREKDNEMALKENGDKMHVHVILDKRINAFVEAQAAKIGLNRSAYIRMLLAKEAEKEEREG